MAKKIKTSTRAIPYRQSHARKPAPATKKSHFPGVKVMIATPAYGEIFYASYVRSLVSLTRLFYKEGISFAFESVSYAEVSEARNYLLTRFFDKSDATHLLFIDADMGFSQQLIADMLAFKKPLVGVVSPKRQVDIERIMEAVKNGEDDKRALSAGMDFILRPLPGKQHSVQNWFMPVEGCGAGIMLIERSCVAKMIEKDPNLIDTKSRSALTKNLDRMIRGFDSLQVKGTRLSEDYAFCYRWREQCGGEVWVNIGHEITHVGLKHFTGRFADRILQTSAEGKPVKSKGEKKTFSGKIIPPTISKPKARVVIKGSSAA